MTSLHQQPEPSQLHYDHDDQLSNQVDSNNAAINATAIATEDMVLTYPGWELDKEEAEKLFIEYSNHHHHHHGANTNTLFPLGANSDCFHRKISAMKNKQRLFEGDRSHPDLVELDAAAAKFNYPGWQADRALAEQRHVGDCILWHMGTYGVQDILQKMQRKQILHSNHHSVEELRELDIIAASLTYPGWELDKRQAETFFVDYATTTSRDDCFSHKLKAMQNKQCLHEGDRSHPDIVALDSTTFTYKGWEADRDEAIRRHTGDCRTFHLSRPNGFESLWHKMLTKQQLHQDRASLPGLRELDAFDFNYDGWQVDKAVCEKFFVEFSTVVSPSSNSSIHENSSSHDTTSTTVSASAADCFHRKFVAMKVKQQLFDGDCSHPEIRALDATVFEYPGWQDDKEEAIKRLTGDCILLHMGSVGFQEALTKMKKKQALYRNADRSSIPGLRHLDAIVAASSSSSSSLFLATEDEENAILLPASPTVPTESQSEEVDITAANDPLEAAPQQEEINLFASSTNNVSIQLSTSSSRLDRNDLPLVGVSTSSTGNESPASDNNTTPLATNGDEEGSNTNARHQNKCVVCLENAPSHAFIPCGHMCICEDCTLCCSNSNQQNNDICPLCRERSYCVTKIYC